MIHVNAQAACSDLPTSGKHSLQHQDMGNATFHSGVTPACAGTWTSTVTSLLQRLLYRKERCQLKLLRLFFFFFKPNHNTKYRHNLDFLLLCTFTHTSPSGGRPGQEGQSSRVAH